VVSFHHRCKVRLATACPTGDHGPLGLHPPGSSPRRRRRRSVPSDAVPGRAQRGPAQHSRPADKARLQTAAADRSTRAPQVQGAAAACSQDQRSLKVPCLRSPGPQPVSGWGDHAHLRAFLRVRTLNERPSNPDRPSALLPAHCQGGQTEHPALPCLLLWSAAVTFAGVIETRWIPPARVAADPCQLKRTIPGGGRFGPICQPPWPVGTIRGIQAPTPCSKPATTPTPPSFKKAGGRGR